MIISCSSCSTKFKINPKDIGTNGRFVRCSQCDHEWLATAKDNCAIKNPDASDNFAIDDDSINNNNNITNDNNTANDAKIDKKTIYTYNKHKNKHNIAEQQEHTHSSIKENKKKQPYNLNIIHNHTLHSNTFKQEIQKKQKKQKTIKDNIFSLLYWFIIFILITIIPLIYILNEKEDTLLKHSTKLVDIKHKIQIFNYKHLFNTQSNIIVLNANIINNISTNINPTDNAIYSALINIELANKSNSPQILNKIKIITYDEDNNISIHIKNISESTFNISGKMLYPDEIFIYDMNIHKLKRKLKRVMIYVNDIYIITVDY